MFTQVNKITADLKCIDPHPVDRRLIFCVVPDPIGFNCAGIIPKRERRSIALGAQMAEKAVDQRVCYAFAAGIFLRFLHFG